MHTAIPSLASTCSLHGPKHINNFPLSFYLSTLGRDRYMMKVLSSQQISVTTMGIWKWFGLNQSAAILLPSSWILNNFPFIHSIAMCRMRQFLAVLRSFFHSSLLCTFSCHPSPPTILPSTLTSYCHLFLGLPLNPVVPKFIHNTLLGILFPSILYTCPNQHNLFNLTVSIIVGFLTLALLYWLIASNFLLLNN